MKRIKLLILGALVFAPICYFSAKHLTRAHAAETAPPTKIDVLDAARARGHVLELELASKPFFDALTKVQETESKYHVVLTFINKPKGTPIDEVDWETGAITRHQVVAK